MITPGKYIVEVKSSGKMIWEPVCITLQELWKDNDYQCFISELERHGYLSGTRLIMDGPEVKGLIQWLYRNKKVDASKKEIFQALKNTFELSFNDVRSIQGAGGKDFQFVNRNESENYNDE